MSEVSITENTPAILVAVRRRRPVPAACFRVPSAH